MGKLILVTGGARSGKSRFAEKLVEEYGEPLGYIATGRREGEEMTSRIAAHQERRGPMWQTIEEPLDVVSAIRGHDGYFKAFLLDCVTLWLTNLLLDTDDSSLVLGRVNELTGELSAVSSPIILVSNEVGMGIVPENRLARLFRDLAGEANQILAAAADEVYVTISGLPLKLKG
ncbi:bifunctional adenosylcobinamide kinase/adenosylcobinamide-phosphate guanylyltransferase [Geobacter sp. DSM 9736]|uniref:bifunctional adenosylcobinamide kinase/adenosylcobinamide-phosphate guanylyltransferase n=1 Tax=Geobacter sp. DSM 9736 TaxID=1277350 RepID=UPI000B5043DD|nr:bifunctional adenosylcobinamide kinase/adenosylcobinamide-phosphate guanylyltransferase [Geobacter sp. DSM 9736]SNB46992.1 adenosylcobinamide kinase /adenosylcobinamide-phosphate guanylyltransferase [Geobacter sp. DSM 9736]